MKIPGAFWTAILVGFPLLAAWFEQFFSGAIWAAPLGGLLLIAVKVLEVMRSQPPQPPPGVAASEYDAPSKASRILWG